MLDWKGSHGIVPVDERVLDRGEGPEGHVAVDVDDGSHTLHHIPHRDHIDEAVAGGADADEENVLGVRQLEVVVPEVAHEPRALLHRRVGRLRQAGWGRRGRGRLRLCLVAALCSPWRKEGRRGRRGEQGGYIDVDDAVSLLDCPRN